MNTEEQITQLGYYLNRAFTRIVDDLNRALQEAGIPLNHSQFPILQVLSRGDSPDMSQREMAKRLGKDPAAISRAVNYLEQMGFVARFHVNGCKNGVALTAKARALQPRIEQIIREVTTGLCRDMTEPEVRSGLAFLVRIMRREKA